MLNLRLFNPTFVQAWVDSPLSGEWGEFIDDWYCWLNFGEIYELQRGEGEVAQ